VKNTERVISKVSEILSEVPVKPAEILNLFSSRFFFFFDSALLDFFSKIPAELLSN
jgi:hypothetical protein